VGYFTGSLYPGHSGTEWVIIHDNWGGGDYANPNAIDNEPYLDWKGNIDYLIRVVPQPQGTVVTHPSASGITWPAGAPQLITWRGFSAATVAVDLYRGEALVRTLAASAPNAPAGGSFAFTVPADVANASDYRIRVSGGGQSDLSDNPFAISGATAIQVTSPSAAGINWTAGTNATISWTSSAAAGALTVIHPSAAGIVWTAGESTTVSWSSSGAVGGEVLIQLYQGEVVAASQLAANTGSCVFTLSAGLTPGADYWIKVSSSANPAVSDASDFRFTIRAPEPPVLTLTYPSQPGLTLVRGRVCTAAWSSRGPVANLVKLELFQRDALIEAKTVLNNGSFSWLIAAAGPFGPGFTFRVSDWQNPAVSDASDYPFTVGHSQYVHEIAPAEVTVGTRVTLRGSGFGAAGGKLLVEGVKAPTSYLSLTLSDALAVRRPEVAGVTPAGGAAGEQVTIAGRLFGIKKGKVRFTDAGGASAFGKVLGWSMDPATNASTAVVLVPKKLSGPCRVTVVNAVGEGGGDGRFQIQ
jgi:hypothetical protein